MNSNTTYSHITVCDLLGLSFIVLKLIEEINWSWMWVLLPIWGQIIGQAIYDFVMAKRIRGGK